MKRILLISVILAAMLLSACSSQPSKPEMTFEKIGTEGAMVFVTLVSPSPDEVSAEDLANRLRQDWQNNLVGGNAIEVLVFDNREAPQRWLELWPNLMNLSDAEWEKEQNQIFPHYIATYSRNKTSGLHEVTIFSRDASGKVIRTIKY